MSQIFYFYAMEKRNHFIFSALHVIFWVVFIGLCIKTGALLFSFMVSLFVNPEGAKNLYMGLDLSLLHQFSTWQYVALMSLALFLSGLKAYLAYLVVMVFQRFNLARPFKVEVTHLITQISHVALGTGLLAVIANGYSKWLAKQGVEVHLSWASAEFLFLAGIIFLIAMVFKKGMEFQTENELTV